MKLRENTLKNLQTQLNTKLTLDKIIQDQVK